MSIKVPSAINYPASSPNNTNGSYRLIRGMMKECCTPTYLSSPRAHVISSSATPQHPVQQIPPGSSVAIAEEQCPTYPEVPPPHMKLAPHAHPLYSHDSSFLPFLELPHPSLQKHLPVAYPYQLMSVNQSPVHAGPSKLMRSLEIDAEGNKLRDVVDNNHSSIVNRSGNIQHSRIESSHIEQNEVTEYITAANSRPSSSSSNGNYGLNDNTVVTTGNSANYHDRNVAIAHTNNLNDTPLSHPLQQTPPLRNTAIYPTLLPPPPPLENGAPPPANVIKVPVIRQTIHRNRYIDVPEIHIREIIQPVVKVEEICKEVLVDEYVYTEKIVELNKDVIVDKCVEKVEIQEKVVNVNKDVYEERIIEVPKYKYETIEKYVDVPTENIIDKYVEVPEYIDNIVYKNKVKVVEIPVETVKTIPKINVQYIEKLREVQDINNVDFIDVPVERIVHNKIVNTIQKIVEVPEYETIEVERPVVVEVPGEIVEVPYDVPVYVDEPEYKQVPGKVIQVFKEKVYEKILEKPVPVPSIEYKVLREPVEVPIEVFKHVEVPRYVDQLVEVPRYVPYLLPATILQPYNVQEVVEADPIYEEGTPRYIYDQSEYVPPVYSDLEMRRLMENNKHYVPSKQPNTNSSTQSLSNQFQQHQQHHNTSMQAVNTNFHHNIKPNSHTNQIPNFIPSSPSYRPPLNMSPFPSPPYNPNSHLTFPKNLPSPSQHALLPTHTSRGNAKVPRNFGGMGYAGNSLHSNSHCQQPFRA